MSTITPIPQKNFLKASEVARIFNVDHSTVFLWAKKGKLKAKRTPGRNLRFNREDIERLLETRKKKRYKNKRKEERYSIQFTVILKTVHMGTSRYNTATVTDMSQHGVGMVVEDNNGLLKELGKGDVTGITIMNFENPLFKKRTGGSIRHFETAGAGKIAMGVALT